MSTKTCSADGCGRKTISSDKCNVHSRTFNKCQYDGCTKNCLHDYCSGHNPKYMEHKKIYLREYRAILKQSKLDAGEAVATQ